MPSMPRTAMFASIAVILVGCEDLANEAPPPTKSTRCTLVGCDDAVFVTFVDLLAEHAGALPLTVELTMDGHPATTAEIYLGTKSGGGCWQNGEGVACCSSSPPADEFDCIPEVNGDLRITLHPEVVFDQAVHGVGATVRGADGAVLLSDEGVAILHENQPNGPMCEPTCYQGGVELGDQAE